jgi:DNA uptake protein ComE-like DNA-binding protein
MKVILAAQSGKKDDAAIHQKAVDKLLKEGVNFGDDITVEEVSLKASESGGGWANIEYIEETYTDIVKSKRGNDGTYYVRNLSRTIAFVRREAHSRATSLYHRLEFSTSASTVFDVIKESIDDKLVSLAPELGEKLMLSFENVSAGKNQENWSQALTTCRRLLEELADKIYPPRETALNNRQLGKTQYINRLWAFMDEKIESESNKKLAKAHIDLIGSYLDATHKITNKGVHSEVTRFEAIRTVLHTYLVIGNILAYLDRSTIKGGKQLPNIHSVSRDEIMAIAGVREQIANDIIKLRAGNKQIKTSDILKIKGVGAKTVEKIRQMFSLIILRSGYSRPTQRAPDWWESARFQAFSAP